MIKLHVKGELQINRDLYISDQINTPLIYIFGMKKGGKGQILTVK